MKTTIFAIYILGIVIAQFWMYRVNKGTITPKDIVKMFLVSLGSWVTIIFASIMISIHWWKRHKDDVIL